MTWPETDRAGHRRLLVPLGATEQHGPHLPLETDTIIAEAWAAAVADALPGTTMAPPIPYGSSGEHQGFAGTLSIGGPVLHALVVELARSAASSFDAIVFLSGHAGNDDAMGRAVEQLRAEGHRVTARVPTWPTDRFGPIDAHAGRIETSLLLHLRPDLVRLERAMPGDTRALAEILDQLVADGVASVSPNGVLGDPAGASAEEGRLLLDDLVARTVTALTTVDDGPGPSDRPPTIPS